MDDGRIIGRIREGDVNAFSLLVEKYHRPLLAYIHRLVRDRETVEDLGQDVFLEAYKSLSSFDSDRGAKFSSWLFGVARNRCLTEMRKTNPAVRVSDVELCDIVDPAQSPEQTLIERERLNALGISLQKLPELFRKPIQLSLSGRSLKEIAELCGVSLGTAKSRLARAREKMRFLLRSHAGGGTYERF